MIEQEIRNQILTEIENDKMGYEGSFYIDKFATNEITLSSIKTILQTAHSFIIKNKIDYEVAVRIPTKRSLKAKIESKQITISDVLKDLIFQESKLFLYKKNTEKFYSGNDLYYHAKIINNIVHEDKYDVYYIEFKDQDDDLWTRICFYLKEPHPHSPPHSPFHF